MGNIVAANMIPPAVKIPQNYPNTSVPGKIELLYDANYHDIYHRYSPQTDNTDLFGFGPRQPYVWSYIDDNHSWPSPIEEVSSVVSSILPFGLGFGSDERTLKFMASGRGILFLTKQFLEQTNNAFNETRIYNPASLLSPFLKRHSDSGILGMALGLAGGVAGGLVGGTLGAGIGSRLLTSLLGNPSPPPPPSGTTAAQNGAATVLPTNYPGNTGYGAGLLRAGTVTVPRANLELRFGKASSGDGGIFSRFLSNMASSLFGRFIPKTQDANIEYRSDENTYGLMLASKDRFTDTNPNIPTKNVYQLWLAGDNISIKGSSRAGKSPVIQYRLFTDENGNPISKQVMGSLDGPPVYGKPTGYQTINADGKSKYGKAVGQLANGYISDPTTFQNSDVMVQYGYYIDDARQYPTKKIDKSSVDITDTNLKKVITSIKKSGIYDVLTNTNSYNLESGDATYKGYNRVKNVADPTNKGIIGGMLDDYASVSVRMVSNDLTKNAVNSSYKLPGQGRPDAINTLYVLDGKKKINKFDGTDRNQANQNNLIAGWEEWSPYEDDLIAFYFYDVVNKRYIPFRATIKGLNETNAASWEELTFIGRADRLYSYSGFNRNLTFSFSVVISSIVELIPTWQRINYLMSMVKPARYTKSKISGGMTPSVYDRFMVPPMIMLTIGDLYKNHPIILNTVSIAIPDNATWEIMTPTGGNSDVWTYLAKIIQSPKLGKMYGQFPKEADINVSCFVLEKERAIMGAAHFGHAPRTDEYLPSDAPDAFRDTDPDNQEPSEMDKALSVYQPDKMT